MFNEIKNCLCCESKNLKEYLNLNDQPLANSYHKGELLNKFALRVNFCQECYHNQLSISVDPDELFKNYLYVSGTTETFKAHCKELAADVVKRVKQNPRVLDIACNDGTLLEYFKDLGCKVKGVDPAVNLRKITNQKNIDVHVGYWNQDIDLKEKFDVITGTNVFAHVNDPKGFLQACKNHLNDEGVILLEFPYCKKMLENNEFDTIYHEHISYFLISPILKLLERIGDLCVKDVILTSIHGGSIRLILGKGTCHNTVVLDLLEKEKPFLQNDYYESFSNKIKKQKQDLLFLMESIKDKKIIGYGASAKGNTMLNYFDLSLSYIVDDNKMKHGYLTPGKNIPIFDPIKILEEKEEIYVLLLAWNFSEEIKKRINKMKPNGVKFIKYVPSVEIE